MEHHSSMILCSTIAISAAIVCILISAMPSIMMYVIIGYVSAVVAAAVMFAAYKIYNVSTMVKKEQNNLKRITKIINSMVIIWDTKLGYIDVNPEFTAVLGYTSEQLNADHELLKNILPADAFTDNIDAITGNRDEEFYAAAADGSKVCTIWNTSVVSRIKVHKKNITYMMSIGPNLTETINMKNELVRYSKELADTENKYSLSMELSEIGLLLKESGNSKYYLSDQLRNMFGVESDTITGSDLRALFHPKDRMIYDTFAAVLNGSGDHEAGNIHSAEFRAITRDMTYHWFQYRYKVIPNENFLLSSMGGAILDITRDKEKDILIEKMAYVDDVTQISNRNKFMMIGEEILMCTQENPDLNYWVIIIDVDNFHIINDTCGYANGSRLLADIAAIITANLTDEGFAARIGGDNFALLIKYNGDEELPVRIVKHIQSDILSIHSDALETHSVTCSAGYCLMSDGGEEFSTILDCAEFALSLYDGTKSAITRYDNTVHDKVIKTNEIEKELAKAIENNELCLYYQPKIDLNTGEIMGMEALIRWIKPNGKIVLPCDFIPVAESSMLITKISEFVLHEACRQNKLWQDMGLKPVVVSINLTAIDFYQTNVIENIRNALDETGLDARWLDIELTESLALKDIDSAINQMNEIKKLGVSLSMDDFGTGYSSLSYIQVLPITLLKLDRSFIMYLEEDVISREIVSAVIRIAKSKKIETIAEGIETIGQSRILRESGCDWAQGYLFGKPMPADKFEDFLRLRMKEPAQV